MRPWPPNVSPDASPIFAIAFVILFAMFGSFAILPSFISFPLNGTFDGFDFWSFMNEILVRPVIFFVSGSISPSI